jgi:hypothetical protein
MADDITAKLVEALTDLTDAYNQRLPLREKPHLWTAAFEALAEYLKAKRQHTEAQAGGTGGADPFGSKAFAAYLKDCDDCAIVPDVAGAFNGGWTANRAALAAAPAAAQGDVREQFEAWYAERPDGLFTKEVALLSAQHFHEAGRQQGMDQANALWEMAKTETTGDRCAPCTKRCDDCPIDWARLTAEPTTPSKAAILDAVTKLFPRWREDIQEKFVLQVASAVLALRPAEMAKAEQAVPVASQWIPMHERAPAPDTDCVVYLRYSLDRPPFIATDRWEMQSEDPTGMGGPTMETGYGWRDNFESDVIAWMAVGELPPETWDQRLPTAGTTEQAKEQKT